MGITNDGKTHIKRYLAGFVPAIARSVAFGIGDQAEAVGQKKLQFEVARTDITLTTYDFVNNRLIFKASVPTDFTGKIYEAAIYSLASNTSAGNFGGQLITSFDSATEDWADATTAAVASYATTNTRIGDDSLRQTPVASASKTDSLKDLELDLSGYSAADQFTFALNVGNTNTSGITFYFLTDASNYYSVAFSGSSVNTAGYKFLTVTKSTATPTGNPNWANITEVQVKTTSGSGGGSQIDFDGIRIDDIDSNNPDYIMVSREVITPFTKAAGRTNEIEFSLGVTV